MLRSYSLPNFDSWPTGDHTTGTGKCLITGAGSSSNPFGTGVTGGTSTVLSPIFDVNNFANPVVEYYRWFSNEQGYQNFKNDPWIVKMRTSPSAAWTTVENTYQADINWRHRIFRVNSFIPGRPLQLQMMFVASDSLLPTWAANGQSITVGGVDDFFVYDQAATLATPSLPLVKAEIYPNPANDKVQVVLQGNNTGSIKVYDMLGNQVTAQLIDQNNSAYTVNTANLAAGSYNLVIQTEQSIQSKKIVVVHP